MGTITPVEHWELQTQAAAFIGKMLSIRYPIPSPVAHVRGIVRDVRRITNQITIVEFDHLSGVDWYVYGDVVVKEVS